MYRKQTNKLTGIRDTNYSACTLVGDIEVLSAMCSESYSVCKQMHEAAQCSSSKDILYDLLMKASLDQLVLAQVFPDGQGHSAQPRPGAKNGNRNIAEEKEAKRAQ